MTVSDDSLSTASDSTDASVITVQENNPSQEVDSNSLPTLTTLSDDPTSTDNSPTPVQSVEPACIQPVEPVIGLTVVENHTEVLSRGERDNKIIIEANTKATTDNLIPPLAVTIIIIMVIIKVEVAVAMVETITDHVIMEEAITRAITITNAINITPMMLDPRSNNMVHHAHFVVVSIILLNIVLRENMTSIISWRK